MLTLSTLCLNACSKNSPATHTTPDKAPAVELKTIQLSPKEAKNQSAEIEAIVTPSLANGITIKNWAVDKLVADPIAIDIDDFGRIYYTRTIRRRNSEYDIRAHREWESESVKLKSVEEKRAFLHKTLSPENSDLNDWLTDLNGDGSHDWRDMRIEKEHVYRLEDTDHDGLADSSKLVVDDFNDETTDVAGAVLSHEDDLFVGVGPDMWRMRDSNGDEFMDEKLSLAHGFGIHIGFSGHGMSGAEMGPDGRIYWGIGDIGFNGKGNDKDGKVWEYPNRGVIARANPDGSDFEIFAMGVRNTHEFVFDEYANLISVDNDGDHNGEKERIVYLTNGSDTGWRITWQLGKYRDPKNNSYKVWMDEKLHLPRFEGQAAYITPAVASFVSGPTGMAYNPGTALSSEWKNTFFVAEFTGSAAKSGIHAFRLKPNGATFDLNFHEKFAYGVLATGMDFAPDGALYFADWVDGWSNKDVGRIWTLDSENSDIKADREHTAELLPLDFSGLSANELAFHLENADMRVRQKAQFSLVKKGSEGAEVFSQTLANSRVQLARVHAIWGLSQLARQNSEHAKLLLPYLKDEDEEIRAQSAKWLGDIRYNNAAEQLVPLLEDSYPRARFFAAEALGRIKYAPAIPHIIQMLQKNDDEDAYLRHAGSLALARIGEISPVANLALHDSRALRIAAVVALRRMQAPEIATFLNDKDEFIVTETARAINDDYSIEAALPALANLLAETTFDNEALIRRAINANLRLGTDRALENVIQYADNANAPETLRYEAVAALATWASPSDFDRVDGRFRGEIVRPLAPIQNKVSPLLTRLLSSEDDAVRTVSATALGTLKVHSASTQLAYLLAQDSSPAVRSAALDSLSVLQNENLNKALEIALKDSDKNVRATGLKLLTSANLEESFIAEKLSDIINTGSRIEKQTSLKTLSELSINNSRNTFEYLLGELESQTVDKGIVLDLVEAIEKTKDAELVNSLNSIKDELSSNATEKEFMGTLHGGDFEAGKNTVFHHQTAQCIKCHTFYDTGGTAGPQLNGIGSRLTAKEILEALVNPSARIAPGYGYITLKLKNGDTVNGLLHSEDEKSYRLTVGDDEEKLVSRDDVETATSLPSSMPNMSYYLSKQEIRDVVKFLSEL